MDPKSPLFNKTLPIATAIYIIDEWLSRGWSYYWDITPEELKATLIENAVDGNISYGSFCKLVDKAKTCKMPGHANRGLDFFKQEFKKIIK